MTKRNTSSHGQIAESSLAELQAEIRSLRHEKHGVAVLFDRRGNEIGNAGGRQALVAGFSAAVLKTWRSIESAERSPAAERPAMAITARFQSSKWDSRALRDRLQEIVSAFFRGHHPLPGVEPAFTVNWYRLRTGKEVDTAINLLKASRGVAKKRPTPATDKRREPTFDAIASTAELSQIVAELERIKEPLRQRLQRVLDGLAERNLDSVELNAQVVKQINAVRTALGLGLRLKESGEPIYLRCVVASRARTATIQAVTADQKRANLAASPTFPALEAFESEQNS
jgi:hypothetical protein